MCSPSRSEGLAIREFKAEVFLDAGSNLSASLRLLHLEAVGLIQIEFAS